MALLHWWNIHSTLGGQLGALFHRAQRQVLVALFHQKPQDDTPVDSDDVEFENKALERLFDLLHYHLPVLASKGFIDYDRKNHRLTKGPMFNEIKPLVELIDMHADELPDDWL